MSSGHPGQIEGIDRNAVAAKSRPGIECLEAEWFALGCLDHLPDINTHSIIKHLQFIDECDVDGAVSVFKNLACLRHFGAGDGNDPDDHSAIKSDREFQAGWIQSPHHLGNGRRRKLRVPGVFALWAESKEKVAPGFQSSGCEQGENHLPGGSRVSGALQDDQLAGSEPLCYGLGRVDYIRQVRLAGLGQWSRDTDDDHIRLIESLKGSCGFKALFSNPPDCRIRNVTDVALSLLELGNLDTVDIEPQHRDSPLREGTARGRPT